MSGAAPDSGPVGVVADLARAPGAAWNRHLLPGSALDVTADGWRFSNAPTDGSAYTNSQVDDYQGLPRRRFRWRPPLTLSVRARFSHPAGHLQGTAGFGFWNDPFLMTGLRPPALPRAIWFFYSSSQSNMKLDLATPGSGWKAATIDALRLPAALLMPLAPIAVPLMNVPALYRTLWRRAQPALKISEALVPAEMRAWHTYRLHWGIERAVFHVDDEVVLDCATPPGGPLGFVMWIDNQSLVATPWGAFHWRKLPLPEQQWMAISELRIEPGAPGE